MNPERLGDIRRIAAAAYDRKQVRFENVVTSSTLSSQYTSEWVYPLGEAFVSAVVELYGDGRSTESSCALSPAPMLHRACAR